MTAPSTARVLGLVAAFALNLCLDGCGSGVVSGISQIVSNSTTSVSVSPMPGEDLSAPCTFNLLLQEPDVPQAGVLVIYERGDSAAVYHDAGLRALAKTLHFSMLWAEQCNAHSTGDLQADASKGPGRMLFAALGQLAVNNNRPELATTGVAAYGFSAAGVLVASLVAYQPARLVAAIEFASGDSYLPMRAVPVTKNAAGVPSLILANAEDTKAGTWTSFDYFKRGRAQSAPWAFAVQKGTNHCCTTSTLPLLKPWLAAVVAGQSVAGAGSFLASDFPEQTFASFVCAPDGEEDAGGQENCSFQAAALSAGSSTNANAVALPAGSAPATAWLPATDAAAAWLKWVASPQTN